MKNTFRGFKAILILFIFSSSAFAQNNFWTDQSDMSVRAKQSRKIDLPQRYRTLRLDTANFLKAIQTAPKELSGIMPSNPLILTIPMPDNSFSRFKITETSMMEPELASRFSSIKTYSGQGIDDPYATIKIDWTEFGLHAMILSQINGSVLIDPYSSGTVTDYISYYKKDVAKAPFVEEGLIKKKSGLGKSSSNKRTIDVQCIGTTLRKYRLAVACTWQYAVAVGGRQVTPVQAFSAIVTTINRVNGVYESELDVSMVLVADNNKIVFTDSATQPFTGNNSGEVLIDESQKVIDSIIGSANYDIGHTFSTGAGGYAAIGVVCDNSAKAMGVTGNPQPKGDNYDIDYVCHEIGHQFGANHTFNALTGNCGGGNGNAGTNAEPGSGSTIMAYAGICFASNNLQPHSIPYFHAVSLDEITGFMNAGGGSSCAIQTATGNTPPVVSAGNDYVIPKSTPFVLNGSATDANGDALTYSWEEIDVNGPFGDWNKPFDNAPIFRSFAPVATAERYFPVISDIVNNTSTIGEVLPSYQRDLHFRLTARDNRSGGGGVCFDEATVTVADAGPFVVTSPNIATVLNVGSFLTVMWDVSNTNKAPVNCTNVSIELSVDGGVTFPIALVTNTANDGEEEILVPNYTTTAGRIRVKAVGNIFFDISNFDFTINSTSDYTFNFNNPAAVKDCNVNPAGIINTSALNNFSSPVALTATGNPAGSAVLFSNNPVNPGSTTSVTLQGNIEPGTYNVTVTGTAGAVVKTTIVRFIIGAPTFAPVNLYPSHNSTGYLLLPVFDWEATTEAQYYSLNISTSPDFTANVLNVDNIYGSNYTLVAPLAANTEYYWRVVPHNSCGAGPASIGFRFKTDAIVCPNPVNSSNVPITISTTSNTISSTLNIAAGGVIQDVDVVGLRGKHLSVDELTVSLVSPSNTSVILFTETCFGGNDFNLTFDDDAENEITCPLNTAQTARPYQHLSAFTNEVSTGTWKLQVSDPYDKNGGSLDNWGLRICTYQATALPVSWISFIATNNDNKNISLQWFTSNEINNKYYEIEKSGDGASFNSIGRMNAGSNLTSTQQYLFNDLRPYAGDNYYRLKQVDKDGKFSYSRIVKVSMEDKGDKYIVYPNPAVNKTTVRILSEMKDLKMTLADASGKLVYKRSVGSAKPGEEFEIPVKRYGKGLYVLNMTTEKGTSNEKVLVQ